MFANREGRFLAKLGTRGVAPTGPNQLVTFTAQFLLVHESLENEWADCSEDGLEITGYFYLEKRDGTLNSVTIDNLKKAFGWDGLDPFWLEDADLGERLIQVTLGFEEYDGKSRLKVKWVDTEDATPTGVRQSDASTRRQILSRLGAKFRAHAGGAPAPAPKPAGAPKAVNPVREKPPTRKAKPAADAKPAGTTMERAWELFSALATGGAPEGHLEREWFRLIEELFPGNKPDELAPENWELFVEKMTKMYVPF